MWKVSSQRSESPVLSSTDRLLRNKRSLMEDVKNYDGVTYVWSSVRDSTQVTTEAILEERKIKYQTASS